MRIQQTLTVTGAFTRTLITYPSDGLTIYGFMDLPRGQGPFPVIIALHGYVSPTVYRTLDYTTRYADALAEAGYLVLHPNLRGYPPSDSGPDLFRVGEAIDTLNLITLVRETGGKPGPLEAAESQAIGVWGHSNGGGIALRVITISPDVRAAVLYGAMSGDEKQNFEQVRIWSGGRRTPPELSAPADALARISAINYLDHIQAAVSINHGAADSEVPPAWSTDLYARLQALHKTVEYYSYPGQNHLLQGPADTLFIRRMISFYDKMLK
ncbi:MAG: alpha/beta hydrolase family protein [Rudaea sp.]